MQETTENFRESDRREADRIDCTFPANMKLLFPEESFTPVDAIVLVTDVSYKGVKVICPPFPDRYRKCIPREGLFAKLNTRHGDRTRTVYCQVRWVRERTRRDGTPLTELGLAYHERGAKRSDDSSEHFFERAQETKELALRRPY